MQAIQKIEPISSAVSNVNTWGDQKVRIIKDMYFKESSDLEFQVFCHVAQKTGLDPTMRQIHPVKRWDSTLRREVMTIQTGIDGYRLIAERTGKYAPGREPTYAHDSEGRIISATAYVKKQTIDGTWHEVSATAFWLEYVQKKKDGTPSSFWMKMPYGQLAKCAEALALRKAFPMEMSGIYTKEEMAQATNEVDPIELQGFVESPVDLAEETEEYINISLQEFCKHFPGEEESWISSYIKKYATYWKKRVDESIKDYSSQEKFWADFIKWKKKELNKSKD